MCQTHYRRYMMYGDPLADIPNQKYDRNGLAKKFKSEHNSWSGAKYRCLNQKNAAWSKYGGRGIKICERWLGPHGFSNFMEDMGEKPDYSCSLDRINNDGDYCPENCRWGTPAQQTKNRKNTLYIEHKGVSKTIQEWCEIYDLPYNLLWKRVKKGVSDDALFLKSRKNHIK